MNILRHTVRSRICTDRCFVCRQCVSNCRQSRAVRNFYFPWQRQTQRAQRSKKFDPDRNFWSRSKFLISLENFDLHVSISPQKIGPRWVAGLKISFSLEIFNPDRNLEFFWSLGPLGICGHSFGQNSNTANGNTQVKIVKVACLQSEIFTKDFLFELRIFLRKMLRYFPRNVWAFNILCVRKKSRSIPAKFPAKFRCQESNSGTPNPWYLLNSIAGTNGRRTAVQIGGVLRLEVYCGVSLSPKFRSRQGAALQMGGVLRYKLEVYHLSQHYYITARYFWTINFGRRNVKITSQNVFWNYFLGAVISDRGFEWFSYRNSWRFWASRGINFWRRNVIFTSQKLKTNYFRNSFGTDGTASTLQTGCKGWGFLNSSHFRAKLKHRKR